MRTVSLAAVGLLTVDETATELKVNEKTVRRWITEGLLPVVAIGEGNRSVYLLRRRDVDRFEPPPRGRPEGSKNKASAAAEK